MSSVVFRTRPGWVGEEINGIKEIMGDLIIDGEDLGWTSIDDACSVADQLEVQLEIVEEADYVVKNPRREETIDGDQ